MNFTKETYVDAGVDLTDVSQWQPLRKIPNHFPQFTVSQILLMSKLRKKNGLEPICKSIGGTKKLYMHTKGFGVFVANC